MKLPQAAAVAWFAAAGLAHAGSAAVVAPSPILPGYGQDVVLSVTQAPLPLYLPTTRYTRTGTTFNIDYDYLYDGFGPLPPPGADFGFPDVNVGELPPGNYTVVSRMHDMANPQSAPMVATANVAVVPPQDWGVYVVPANPGANDVVNVVIRSAAYFNASSMRATVVGNTVRVDFDYRASAPASGPTPAGLTTYASIPVGRLAAGSHSAEGWGRPDTGGDPQRYFTSPFYVASQRAVVEYYQEDLNHYFITANPAEIDMLDAGGQGGWKRTGQSFQAWLTAQEGPPAANSVCRFYAAGPNSHFYTGDSAECAGLKALEQTQRAAAAASGQPFLGWAYEGIAFWAILPTAGVCPAGSNPVWRSFNNRAAENDANHRFTVDPKMHAAMSIEWADEGIAFCSPQ